MGQSASKNPELQVYEAVARNDLYSLQRIINHLRTNDIFNPSVHLEWADKEGCTPLLIASSKNYYQCAKKLLESGANVLYVNPAPDVRGGTALHEATRNRHEALAELLLSCGAYPFQCNYMGRTCMDEAVLAESVNLLRRYEQAAPWQGTVAVKTYKLAGMSQPFKSRHMVVVPQLPLVQARNQSQPPLLRRQLWVFKDTSGVMPKARVWLDGATATRNSATDAVLRLHSSHKPPSGDLASRYDRGYCLYLRAADSSPAAVAALDSLIAHINSTSPQQQPTAGQPAGPQDGIPYYAAPSSTGAASGSTTPLAGQGSYRPATTAPGPAGLGDDMNALPGESDADFANRLASAMTLGGSQTHSQASAGNLSAHPSVTNVSARPQTPSSLGIPHYPHLPNENAVITTPQVGESAPSAPPLQPGNNADESLCVICLSAPREAGYLHGATLHRCVCKDCCGQLRVGQLCPLCRQPIERVVGVY